MYSSILTILIGLPIIVRAVPCQRVNSFNEFNMIVSLAMKKNNFFLCFQPFYVEKQSTKRLVLDGRITLQCEKKLSSDRCQIEGAGNHLTISGKNGQVNIQGFTFSGATESAIRVLSTSRKSHYISDCNFTRNRGSMLRWRGGAIKTEDYTSLVVSNSFFDGNEAAGGGAIFQRGSVLSLSTSTFTNNIAKEGSALMIASVSGTEISNCTFIRNIAAIQNSGAMALIGSAVAKKMLLSGWGNVPCDISQNNNKSLCQQFNVDSSLKPAFHLGELSVNSLGLRLSTGLQAKIIAQSGKKVQFTSPESITVQSNLNFHFNPDAAAVFDLSDGGWIYLSNAENNEGKGGVFGVIFDALGRVRDYVVRQTGTTRNCSGGKTPWNTWVSCEEHSKGLCWQIDPNGLRKPSVTKLVEGGGFYEAMTYDIRNPKDPSFFVTEDDKRGAIRRFKPSCGNIGLAWNLIQVDGVIDYLEFTGNSTFKWTSSLELGRVSAEQYYRNVEGISFYEGMLSFVAKDQKQLFRLNLDKGTYIVNTTDRRSLIGGGSFDSGPDQIIQLGGMQYFTEDGGKTPGVFASDGIDFFTVFEAWEDMFVGDETTGLTFSPDGTKMYVCLQENGYLFEISRSDGLAFPGRIVSQLKFHKSETR